MNVKICKDKLSTAYPLFSSYNKDIHKQELNMYLVYVPSTAVTKGYWKVMEINSDGETDDDDYFLGSFDTEAAAREWMKIFS